MSDHAPDAGEDRVFAESARHTGTPAREIALASLSAGVRAAQPERLVTRRIDVTDDTLRVEGRERAVTVTLDGYDELLVVGGGKAAAGVTRGLVATLGDRVNGGCVVTTGETGRAGPVEFVAGGHPLPNADGVAATRDVMERLDRAGEETLVLAPITGGGSATLAAPTQAVGLDRLRRVTRRLLDAGAPVDAVNALRRRLSTVKGGRLAARAHPATTLGVLVSDVVGDPAVIASGPTVPDPTDADDALAALDRYGIDDAVVRRVVAGRDGPSADHPAFREGASVVIGDGRTATRAACEAAREAGAEARVVSERVTGEARDRGREAAALGVAVADTSEPVALVSGGETTVTVAGDGCGGPNCEYALAAGAHLARVGAGERVVVGALDTDGADGSTSVAGGLVDGTTVEPRAARAALAANDAATALRAHDAALVTGPTGVNVNDLRVVVVE